MAFNVLVVDDSAVMRAMIVRTLQMTGVPLGEIHQAGNGQEALEVLKDQWVDLALVDINMPVMNGEELIERVRENPLIRDLSVIVVSTESSETRIERILNQGAEFVHKPFTAESLRETILQVTGVSDDQRASVGAPPGDDFDF
ncbi:MAG: response regulator [Gemmatimonadota bacterium]|nr:response regulator [Gemmatimonadota bacterium]MDH5760000.1 response regulator [Gemmatimonadota bacterium]